MKKILNTIIACVFILTVFVPVSVFAQGFGLNIDTESYVPLTDIPGFADATSAKNPGGMLKTLFNLSIGIGGILAVIMIIFAGFKYMYEESIFGKSDAKQKLTNAFFGLLLILGSYIILRTINSDLLRINLLLPRGDGALGELIADNNKFRDELYSKLKSASATLGEELRRAEKIEDEAWSLGEKNRELSQRIDALKASGKSSTDPEVLALSQELANSTQKAEALMNEAEQIKNTARQKAAVDFISVQSSMSAVDLVEQGAQTATERIGRINALVDRTIVSIQNDKSLSTEQKIRKIADLQNQATIEKSLLSKSVSIMSAVKADSGALLSGQLSSQTIEKIEREKVLLNNALNKIDQTYSDPATRERARSSIQKTIQSIDEIKKSQEINNSKDRSDILKKALSAATGPLGFLGCVIFCGD